MKRIALFIAIIVLVISLYLGFWPVPIEPVSWRSPSAPGYTDEHAVNNRLADLQIIPLGGEEGPEHVAMGPDGKLYVSVASGKILRMNSDGAATELFASTGGRVLGFAFDGRGELIAADACKGLLSISREGKIAVLVDSFLGKPIGYANSVVVAKNGKIYLSDSSTRFTPTAFGSTFEASVLDILEQSATGRILEYNPATNTTRIVAKGLSFANGVAFSRDEQMLFVAETGRYRVWKISLAANNLDLSQLEQQQKISKDLSPNASRSMSASLPLAYVLLDNLPGYPDNLMRGSTGRIWLGLAKPRNAALDFLADKPFLRKVTLRLPRALWPIPKPYGHVLAFTEDGSIVADLQDPTGAYPETTAVTETNERLYVQSLHAKGLGWLRR